jgi:hypothetical protein
VSFLGNLRDSQEVRSLNLAREYRIREIRLLYFITINKKVKNN